MTDSCRTGSGNQPYWKLFIVLGSQALRLIFSSSLTVPSACGLPVSCSSVLPWVRSYRFTGPIVRSGDRKLCVALRMGWGVHKILEPAWRDMSDVRARVACVTGQESVADSSGSDTNSLGDLIDNI